ncbi:hypothetical protein [uncultured Parabacteroides sp.]|jgi:hypothetical protein|uniref:hypothetical protein n=1 Tax=uncultured Parabacteroides sp. TaxID=512312 RepID=UPI0025EA5C5C|nr:hypothetical protein [uncultured Parabacteroides sp.]
MTKKNYYKKEKETSQSTVNEPIASYGFSETVGQSSPAQYTLDELKAHLAISLEDIKAGRIYSHEEIPNLRPQWKLQ